MFQAALFCLIPILLKVVSLTNRMNCDVYVDRFATSLIDKWGLEHRVVGEGVLSGRYQEMIAACHQVA